jgi:hypothetical protein
MRQPALGFVPRPMRYLRADTIIVKLSRDECHFGAAATRDREQSIELHTWQGRTGMSMSRTLERCALFPSEQTCCRAIAVCVGLRGRFYVGVRALSFQFRR